MSRRRSCQTSVLASLLVCVVLCPVMAEEPVPKKEESERDRSRDKNKIDLSNIDRSDPNAMARMIREKQAAQRKEKEKTIEKQRAEQKKLMEKLQKDGVVIIRKGGEERKDREADPKVWISGKDGQGFEPVSREQGSTLLRAKQKPDSVAPPVNGTPVAGSLLARTRATMASKRLAGNDDAVMPYEPPPATVIELDIDRPLVPNGTVVTKARSVEFSTAPPERKMPENIEEIREEAERRFIQGLNARDTLMRDWSFRFGATYRRREAIPAMVRELKKEGWLSALAAVGLGQIGVAQDDVIGALKEGLSAKEAGVRQTCAHSLGKLRAKAVVRDMAKLIRTEKNFQVRSAFCGAMGQIGDRGAISPLRQVLKAKDEAQMVKAEAALALARLGDQTGSRFLLSCFDYPSPQMQLIGLTGLILLKVRDLPSHLISALGARYEEIWMLAVRTLPSLGPGMVQSSLREALNARLPQVRHRAALALGLMGDRQALPHIQQALLEGNVAERQMAVELLGLLGHRESIPLLIERLREPLSNIRVAAAISLVRLDAKEALPALVEAAQGPKTSLAVALTRGGPLNTQELMVLLGCIRTLKGEQGAKDFETLPGMKSTRWPEYEKELARYQIDVLRGYQLVEIMGSSDKPVVVILRDPHGREQTYRAKEAVASGYRVHEMHMAGVGANAAKDPAYVVLQRGVTRATLFADGRFETKQIEVKGRR